MSPQNARRVIFISGASGSGTTLITRLISKAPQVLTLVGKHTDIDPDDHDTRAIRRNINHATRAMWDRLGDYPQYLNAKAEFNALVQQVWSSKDYAHVSHILMKRSAPFHLGDRYRPDINDLLDLFDDVSFIVIYRDPRASTYSSFRREFAENLKNTAVICEEQLIYLTAQIQTLPPERVQVVSYEGLCHHPNAVMQKVAAFTGLPFESFGMEQEQIAPDKNDQWRRDLALQEADFLEKFFDARRVARWKLLADSAEGR